MSASFNDPPGGRRQGLTLNHDPLSSGGQSSERNGRRIGAASGNAYDNFMPSTPHEPGKEQANVPIVQAGSVTGKSLTLVIAIMCFLACLTVGAVYLIYQSASAWLRDIATEVSIQIEPSDNSLKTERTVKAVVEFIGQQPGIVRAKAMSASESARLLEPWLGKNSELLALPVPRLVAIELNRNSPPDLAKLKIELQERYPQAALDDHRQWQNQIRTVTRSFALGGIAILFLVGAATTAIIVSATRSAMASNREIVEVLDFVGATDRFIAREFEKHFLALGVRAGIVGALSAMAVFFLMPTVIQLIGGDTVTLVELRRLIGTGVLDAVGYILLASVVFVIAALCMVTSRLGVFRILKNR
ncbi:MAG: ABC transporter permease [Pseudomonadota bacterium]